MISNPTSTPIPLETAYNVRGLGGYSAKGNCITSDTFLRGDCIRKMSACDADTLIALGVCAVIDLRGEAERKAIPNTLAERETIQYLPLPLMADASVSRPFLPGSDFSMADVYIDWLENAQENILAVFTALASEAPKGKVLFHCTAGKDRTGLVAALLLGLAGASTEAIAENYALTGENLQSAQELLIQASGLENCPPELRGILLGCEHSSMEKTLKHLETKYGGGQAYLLHIGFAEKACMALSALMQKENEENNE